MHGIANPSIYALDVKGTDVFIELLNYTSIFRLVL